MFKLTRNSLVKKLILLLLLSLGFIGFSYAGGDDRDQEEFLNEPAEVVEEEAKSLLESSQGEAKQASENADEIKKVIAEIEHQLQENEKEINEASEQEKEDYIDSYQGRFIMLSIFILIIIAMYFIRRRLSKVRLDGD
jgi:uncharacterized protein HemX